MWSGSPSQRKELECEECGQRGWERATAGKKSDKEYPGKARTNSRGGGVNSQEAALNCIGLCVCH